MGKGHGADEGDQRKDNGNVEQNCGTVSDGVNRRGTHDDGRQEIEGDHSI
jgi:hypothetical protein